MNRIFNKIKVIVFISTLVIAHIYAQETEKVIGTMGNEKMGEDQIVICVYGTKACMPVKTDTSMTVKYKDKETKLTELPFGLYLEAEIGRDSHNEKTVRKISIDETKTVICFSELNKKQEAKLSKLLKKIKGVKVFNIHSESSQVYIEYNPSTISYKDLENRIKEAGFELE